jgi:conserved hypothetical protein
MSTTPTAPRRTDGLKAGLIVVGGLLALMWLLELIDHASFHALDQLGIMPRQLGSVPHIATAPWLHFGFAHLISNSIPFLVLGLLTWFAGVRTWVITTLLAIACSGAVVWLISPPHSITLGASGLVFGYLAFLLVRGFFTRNLGQILLAVVVFLFYGSVLVGLLPGAAGVSWQGHLGGAIGGLLAARMTRDQLPVR